MRTYEGLGTITYPSGIILKGSFNILYQNSGKTKLTLISEESSYEDILNATKTGPGKFSGKSFDSKYDIYIDKVYFGKLSFFDKKFEFDILFTVTINYENSEKNNQISVNTGLSNFIFDGLEVSQRDNFFTRDKISFRFGNHNAQLVQLEKYPEIKKHLKEHRDTRVTSEFKVTGRYEDLNFILTLTKDFQYLSSLATGNYVASMYQDVYSNDKLIETKLFPLKTYPFSNKAPLIDTSLHGIEEFKEYIEITYPNYVKYRLSLGLPYVLELFITSKIYSPMEVAFLLTTTTIECLEEYYRDWKKLKKLRLRKKTIRLLQAFNVPYQDNELNFVKIRNKIVHEGRFPPNVDKLKSLYELSNLVERLFLSIFEYHGKPYFDSYTRKKNIL